MPRLLVHGLIADAFLGLSGVMAAVAWQAHPQGLRRYWNGSHVPAHLLDSVSRELIALTIGIALLALLWLAWRSPAQRGFPCVGRALAVASAVLLPLTAGATFAVTDGLPSMTCCPPWFHYDECARYGDLESCLEAQGEHVHPVLALWIERNGTEWMPPP